MGMIWGETHYFRQHPDRWSANEVFFTVLKKRGVELSQKLHQKNGGKIIGWKILSRNSKAWLVFPKWMEVQRCLKKNMFSMVKILRIIQVDSQPSYTPPKINSLNLKMMVWKIIFPFPGVYSQVQAVNLPGCISMDVTQVDRPLHWLKLCEVSCLHKKPRWKCPFPATNMTPSKYPNWPTWPRFPQDPLSCVWTVT